MNVILISVFANISLIQAVCKGVSFYLNFCNQDPHYQGNICMPMQIYLRFKSCSLHQFFIEMQYLLIR